MKVLHRSVRTETTTSAHTHTHTHNPLLLVLSPSRSLLVPSTAGADVLQAEVTLDCDSEMTRHAEISPPQWSSCRHLGHLVAHRSMD